MMPTISKSTGVNNVPLTTVEIIAKRFVTDDNGCWNWIGAIDPCGYGRFYIHKRSRLAHRLMWELVGKTLDPLMQLDHLCRNKACVNPKHLEQVTARINIMRSECNSAKNARKTHCGKGHPLSGSNLYIYKTKAGVGRACQTCCKVAWKAYYLRKKLNASVNGVTNE